MTDSNTLHPLDPLLDYYPRKYVFKELKREKQALTHQGTDWRNYITRQNGTIYVTEEIGQKIQLGCHLHEIGRTEDTEDYFDCVRDSITITGGSDDDE